MIMKFIRKNSLLLLICLLGLVLRLYKLGFQSAWLDEIHTLMETKSDFSFGEVYNQVLIGEVIPPQYFIIINFLFKFFGDSIVTARLLSVISGLLAIYIIYILLNEFKLKKEGLIASFLLSVNFFHIYYSQEARPYSLLVLFTLLSFLYFIKTLKKQSWKNFLLYGLFSGLMINFHLFGVTIIFSQGLVVAFYLFTNKELLNKRNILKIITASLLVVLVSLPSIEIVKKAQTLKDFWLTENSSNAFTNIFKDLFGNSEQLFFIFIIGVILFFIKISLVKNEKKLNVNEASFFYFLLLFWILTVILIPLVRSYLSVPMLINRYFICLLPALIILLAIGLGTIKNRFLLFSILFIYLSFSITDLFIIKNYYHKPEKSQFDKASEYVIKKIKKDDIALSSLSVYFQYYFDQNTTIKIKSTNLNDYIESIAKDSVNKKAFWILESHGRSFEINDKNKEILEKEFFLEDNYDFKDAWVRHYILKKDAPKKIDISKYDLSKDAEGDIFKYNVETLTINDNKIEGSGWAFFENSNSNETKIIPIIIIDNVAIIIPSENVLRSDVTAIFGKEDSLNKSGFNFNYKREVTEAKQVSIALILKNEKQGKEGIVFLEKNINF